MRLALRPDLAFRPAPPRLIPSTNTIRSQNCPKRIRIDFLGPMAANDDQTKAPLTKRKEEEEEEEEEEKKKEEKKKEGRKVPPPPPPEKPEPGDCCGSGCVRCVWDVYYDELDEYNRLYGSESNDSRSN